MWLRKLGNTDIWVSPLGLGTVKLGRDRGVKYPEPFDIPDDNAANVLLDLARDRGVNLIDTAPAYGNSEQRLGQLLADQRQHWVICSKVGEEYENGESSFDFSAEHTRLSLERSLRRLRTDYIDIVLVHSDGNDEDILDRFDTLEVLAEAKRAGMIRAFGISTKTVAGGVRAAALCDALMVTYNLGYRDEAPVLDSCQQAGCGVILKKVLASGHLPANVVDPLGASLEFAFDHPATTTAIVGTINPEHLRINIDAARAAIET